MTSKNPKPASPGELLRLALAAKIDAAPSPSADTRAAYEQGVSDAIGLLVRKVGPWEARRLLSMPDLEERSPAMRLQLARAAALRNMDPAVKGARTKQLRRQFRDEGQAIEFAALIRGGETTESARAKMGIGDVKAKRLRAIAVRLGLLRRRQRKAGPPDPTP